MQTRIQIEIWISVDISKQVSKRDYCRCLRLRPLIKILGALTKNEGGNSRGIIGAAFVVVAKNLPMTLYCDFHNRIHDDFAINV